MMNSLLLYVSAGILGFVYLCARIIKSSRRAAFRKAYGCQPVKQLPQSAFMFGFDKIFEFQRLIKDRIFVETSSKLLEEHGGTFSLRISGGEPIWTREPENVKAMLSSKAEDFDIPWMRIKAFQPVTGDSAFSSKGAVWSHGRALLRPAFTKMQISNFDIYEKNFQKFSKLIPPNGSTVDLQELFKRFTLDTASEILFGESVNSLDNIAITKDIGDAFDYASKEIFARSNLGLLVYLYWDAKFTHACEVLDAYIKEFVDKAINFRASAKSATAENDQHSIKKRYIFLEELAKDTSDRKLLRDQLAGNLAAGRDTTAALLTITFWLLARHPQAMQTLRVEVSILKGQLPTYEQLNSMTYLRWVLNEAFRVYPVIPFNGRTAERDTILPTGGGPDGKSPIFISKGTVVIYNSHAMHRCPELWGPDASEFKPERWEKESKLPSKFVPFGGGARTCPGQQLALIESSYLIVRILQTYPVLENRDDSPFREEVGVSLTPAGGAKVALFKN